MPRPRAAALAAALVAATLAAPALADSSAAALPPAAAVAAAVLTAAVPAFHATRPPATGELRQPLWRAELPQLLPAADRREWRRRSPPRPAAAHELPGPQRHSLRLRRLLRQLARPHGQAAAFVAARATLAHATAASPFASAARTGAIHPPVSAAARATDLATSADAATGDAATGDAAATDAAAAPVRLPVRRRHLRRLLCVLHVCTVARSRLRLQRLLHRLLLARSPAQSAPCAPHPPAASVTAASGASAPGATAARTAARASPHVAPRDAAALATREFRLARVALAQPQQRQRRA